MNKKNNVAICLKNITKQYIVHHEKPTLMEKLVKRHEEQFVALHNINLTINKGEKIGIIGPNGSGKTTLLKLIAGICTPTSGTIETHGKIVSLIDLDAGFHPDLTGEQNVYLSGILLGMTKKEVEDRYNKIVTFAHIEQFMDVPLYTYSKGMKLRLGFSVAIHTNPDILIMDEDMTVGDKDFQIQTYKIMKHYLNSKKTLIVATHWIGYLQKNCQKIVMIKNGEIHRVGGREVLSMYEPHPFLN